MQQNRDTFWIRTGFDNYLYLMTNVKKALHGSVTDDSILGFTKFFVKKNQINNSFYKDKKNNIFIGTNLDVFKFLGRDEKTGLTSNLYTKICLVKRTI